MAAAAVLAAVAASALAAAPPPRWVPPRGLSQKGADAVIPDVDVDAKGTTIVIWEQALDPSSTVDAIERPAGGPWGAPGALSQPADHVGSPQLAVAGDSVAAVWDRFDGRNLLVQTANRDSKTHAWSAPVALSLSGRDAQAPQVAVNARGDAVAVWASVGLSRWTIQAAFRPAGGSWQPVVPIQSPQAGTAAPDVVVDTTGRATAVWAATSGSGWRVYASTRGIDGFWSKPTALSGPDATGSIEPQLALEGTNDVLAVWSRSTQSGSVIESSTLSATTGAWSPVAQPFPVSNDALAPAVAVNRRGDGVIVWTSSEQRGLVVTASVRRPGKSWSAPVVLSGAGSGAQSPRVALDARGDALAVWTEPVGGFSRVETAALNAGVTAWSAPRALSSPGADALTPTVALDAAGDGAVAWARYDGRSFVIQADGYDRNGPTLSRLSIPAAGTVGRRLTFTVAPKDVWTTVRAIRWTFGDGTAGSGRATGHVYTRPGRYAARVTVTDAFGHATSERRLITIARG